MEAVCDNGDHRRDKLRGVLIIRMDHDDDIGSGFKGESVASLLVPAVSLIDLVNMDLHALQAARDVYGVVAAFVINENNHVHDALLPNFLIGTADGFCGIVGRHDHYDFFVSIHKRSGTVLEQKICRCKTAALPPALSIARCLKRGHCRLGHLQKPKAIERHYWVCETEAMLTRALLIVCLALSWAHAEKLKVVRETRYSGMADASGAVALTTNLFAVADDEDNILRVYRSEEGGGPVAEFDCTAFLDIKSEADLEGAARIGERAFWIGSHGRNKKGKERLDRGCLFATDIKMEDGKVQLTPVGRPYKHLLADFLQDSRLARFHLAEAASRAPKSSGALNIEGVSATPDGHLLIGFRNPIPQGKALLVPLLNPNEVVQGKEARLGDPIQLDLNGLGIRDIAFCSGKFVIIGGPYNNEAKFELFVWKGEGSEPEAVKVKHLNRYHPEALVIYPDKGLNAFQILSDDGTEPVDGVPGKEVKSNDRKSFRSFWVEQRHGRDD